MVSVRFEKNYLFGRDSWLKVRKFFPIFGGQGGGRGPEAPVGERGREGRGGNVER